MLQWLSTELHYAYLAYFGIWFKIFFTQVNEPGTHRTGSWLNFLFFEPIGLNRKTNRDFSMGKLFYMVLAVSADMSV